MKKIGLLVLAISTAASAQITNPNQIRGIGVYANELPGADAGAKINAADAKLGTASGTIIYSSPTSDTATTNVTLSSNHKLVLQSPINWTATITLPTNSSGQDISCPAVQTLAYATSNVWIRGNTVSRVKIHDCNFAGQIVSGVKDTGIALNGASNITISNNVATDALLVTFGSTAAFTTCADGSSCQYPNVTAGNSTSNVIVSDNKGTSTGGTGVFITPMYVNGATITGNVASGFYDAVEFWGGDSCIATCTAGQNGALANARKATNLTITNNVFTNSIDACIWGSMGQYVTISNNVCTGNDSTTDVGLDVEGTFDATVSGNTASGYRNGDLATFFLSTRVSFDHNRVSQDVAANPIIAAHNSTNSPSGLIQSFTNNELNCTAATVCKTQFDAAEVYNIAGNNFHNTYLNMSGLNTAQAIITNNDFDFSVTSTIGIYVDTMTASSISGNSSAIVRGNRITSSISQAAGSRAIFVNGHDPNNASNLTVNGNILGGPNAFPIDIECDSDANNAVFTYCTLVNNTLAANNIVTTATGSGFVQVQNFNNTVPSNNTTMKYSGTLGNQTGTFGVDPSGNLISTPIKSITGARYVCVNTAGQLISQATACSGT